MWIRPATWWDRRRLGIPLGLYRILQAVAELTSAVCCLLTLGFWYPQLGVRLAIWWMGRRGAR